VWRMAPGNKNPTKGCPEPMGHGQRGERGERANPHGWCEGRITEGESVRSPVAGEGVRAPSKQRVSKKAEADWFLNQPGGVGQGW